MDWQSFYSVSWAFLCEMGLTFLSAISSFISTRGVLKPLCFFLLRAWAQEVVSLSVSFNFW